MRHSRANALPETALVMSLVLLLLFGVVQMALVDFYQLSADGASFMAAEKTVEIKGSGAGSSQSTAQNIANALFSHVALADVSIASSSSSGAPQFEADVVHQLPLLGSVPGFPSSIRIQSRTVEAGVAAPPTTAVSFCAKNLGSGSVAFLANTVNGVGATGLSPIVTTVSNVTSVNATSLLTHRTSLTNLNTALQNLFSSTNGVQTDLNTTVAPLLSNPLLGSTLQTVLNLISGVEVHALKGVATTSELNGLLTTVNTLLGTLSFLLGGSTLSKIVNDVTSIVSQLTTINTSQSYLNSLSAVNALC